MQHTGNGNADKLAKKGGGPPHPDISIIYEEAKRVIRSTFRNKRGSEHPGLPKDYVYFKFQQSEQVVILTHCIEYNSISATCSISYK